MLLLNRMRLPTGISLKFEWDAVESERGRCLLTWTPKSPGSSLMGPSLPAREMLMLIRELDEELPRWSNDASCSSVAPEMLMLKMSRRLLELEDRLDVDLE